MNLDKLKLKARKHESREEWRKAIDVYLKAIEGFESGDETVGDLALYNRVGDLYMKINSTASAVQSYERAVDLYSNQGLANQAIALCGKILRANPGRVQTYLRLARLHAGKNVVVNSKKNLLEYLERMNALGHRDDAITEITAFGEEFARNDDIRTMLTQLLRALSRNEETPQDLEKLADELEAMGAAAEAGPSGHGMSKAGTHRPSATGGLVFLDTGVEDYGRDSTSTSGPDDSGEGGAEVEELEIDHGAHDDAGEAADIEALEDVEATKLETESPETVETIEGLLVDTAAELGDELPEGIEGLDIAIEHTAESNHGEELTIDEAVPQEADVAQSLVATSTTGFVADHTFGGGEVAEDEAGGEEEAPEGGGEGVSVEAGAAEGPLAFLREEEPVGPSIEDLEDQVLDDPDDPWAHRALGEALIAAGEQERGTAELELALLRYETKEDWSHASDVVNELLRLAPNQIPFYQKRVEMAFRSGEKTRLVEAYLALGDVLVRVGAMQKAMAVYGRVLEHDPENTLAQAALHSLEPVEEAEPRATAPPAASPQPSNDFVDLGQMLLQSDRPKDARIRIKRTQPTGDEAQDFAEILEHFKRGIEETIEAEDYQSHYDLGIAFKEMGLLDEAIAEFQKALRAPEGRLRTSEALGLSFYEKEQYPVAESILKRAIDALPGQDDEKIGLLYWLGRAREELQKYPEALACYERAMAVDIQFQDLGDRVARLNAAQRS
ncbi:MAG: tetratricopeptide repeat protein [Gemmatimonadales bacterium]